MSTNPKPRTAPPERTALGLLKDLQATRIKGADLDASDRRRVIEHLSTEGCSVAEIAELVGLHERTVKRDRQAIRQGNALEVNDALVPEMVGALVRQADVATSRLRRISRDRETPAAARVVAELGCWQIGKELVETLQGLGYLPSAAQELRASLSIDQGPEYAELQRELERMGSIVGPEFAPQITAVRETIDSLAAPAVAADVCEAGEAGGAPPDPDPSQPAALVSMTPMGSELFSNSRRKPGVSKKGGANSGALCGGPAAGPDSDLARVVAGWAGLPARVRAGIAAMAGVVEEDRR